MLVFQSNSVTWRSLTSKTSFSSLLPGAKAQLSRIHAYLKRIYTVNKTFFLSLAPLHCSMQCSIAKPRQSVSPKSKATAACWPPSAAELTKVWYTGNKWWKTTCRLQPQMSLSTWHNGRVEYTKKCKGTPATRQDLNSSGYSQMGRWCSWRCDFSTRRGYPEADFLLVSLVPLSWGHHCNGRCWVKPRSRLPNPHWCCCLAGQDENYLMTMSGNHGSDCSVKTDQEQLN